MILLGAEAGLRMGEMLALTRLACDVPEDIDDAPVFAAITSLLDAYEEFAAANPGNRRRLMFLVLAATVARTPDVPVPAAEWLKLSLDSAPRSAVARQA